MSTADLASAIRNAARHLGTNNAATEMGAIEAHAAAIERAAENIAAAIRDLADAVRDTGTPNAGIHRAAEGRPVE